MSTFPGSSLLILIFNIELTEKEKKIVAFNALVHRLPKTNLALLRALVQFLIIIVSNSDVNKMTVRNVGIVFAPTLNIPAPVFSLFLTEFESIFEHSPYSNPNVELVVPQSMSPEDIRSPRHQMFSDIPTPADSTFRRNGDPRDEIPTRHDTGFIPMQPSYEQSMDRYAQDSGMLMPNPDSRSAKAKRRESSLLFMDMNQTPPGTLSGGHGKCSPAGIDVFPVFLIRHSRLKYGVRLVPRSPSVPPQLFQSFALYPRLLHDQHPL